ncbi:hypothetical protein K469DRAFT_704302 [Zopfia rhizophila CBS 207.26]|uniref:Carbohydrate-binding module family 13 protein n=1 Tax=Zopfia rhizophila CBS 207.26 TaxID=1314779 RepID=A0A6A6EBU6_9PEZI|nr:hypothetical protein K469DRAFT_704302 [Zopfia rhizophila CBS 207.26]
MVDIDLNEKYTLTNSLVGNSKVLASSRDNEQVVVESAGTNDNQLWYFMETNVSGTYRMHTVQKGDAQVLEVLNFYGVKSLGLHFFNTGPSTGQYWRLDEWDDGSVKITNEFSGPDIHLGVTEGSLEPTLAGGDKPGQHWTLSQLGSTPTSSATRTGSLTELVTKTISPIATSELLTNIPSPCASTAAACTTSASTPNSNSDRNAIIGGAVGGGVAGLALSVAGIWLYLRKRRQSRRMAPLTDPMMTIPHVNRNA